LLNEERLRLRALEKAAREPRPIGGRAAELFHCGYSRVAGYSTPSSRKQSNKKAATVEKPPL